MGRMSEGVVWVLESGVVLKYMKCFCSFDATVLPSFSAN